MGVSTTGVSTTGVSITVWAVSTPVKNFPLAQPTLSTPSSNQVIYAHSLSGVCIRFSLVTACALGNTSIIRHSLEGPVRTFNRAVVLKLVFPVISEILYSDLPQTKFTELWLSARLPALKLNPMHTAENIGIYLSCTGLSCADLGSEKRIFFITILIRIFWFSERLP